MTIIVQLYLFNIIIYGCISVCSTFLYPQYNLQNIYRQIFVKTSCKALEDEDVQQDVQQNVQKDVQQDVQQNVQPLLKPLKCSLPNSPPCYLLDLPNLLSSSTHSTTVTQSTTVTPSNDLCNPSPTPIHYTSIDCTYIPNLVPSHICKALIESCSKLCIRQEHTLKNKHSSLQLYDSPSSPSLTSLLTSLLEPHLPRLLPPNSYWEAAAFHSLNRRLRVYAYEGSTLDTFRPHVDAGWSPSALEGGEVVDADDGRGAVGSRYSLLLYLNADFEGGETTFFDDGGGVVAAVEPTEGGVLLFPQALGRDMMEFAESDDPAEEGHVKPPVHEGSVVREGTKWVVRSDVIYEHEGRKVTDPMTKYDEVVRRTMRPRLEGGGVPVHNPEFLERVDRLYEPVMGVENLGYLMHSLVKFLKPRRVVEVGAGFTTLFILAALRENDEEMSRIKKERDRLRLLDYPWVVDSEVEGWGEGTKSVLTVIDNCRHQKQTATAAEEVAEELGLRDRMDFVVGDAFEQTFEAESVDLLFCDFGVGAKMKDFMEANFGSLRPGGYVVVHSTLTNRNTRAWVEMVRRGAGKEQTGIPKGELEHVSFLERHKRFQNSITVFQRRTEDYAEPLYSVYA